MVNMYPSHRNNRHWSRLSVVQGLVLVDEHQRHITDQLLQGRRVREQLFHPPLYIGQVVDVVRVDPSDQSHEVCEPLPVTHTVRVGVAHLRYVRHREHVPHVQVHQAVGRIGVDTDGRSLELVAKDQVKLLALVRFCDDQVEFFIRLEEFNDSWVSKSPFHQLVVAAEYVFEAVPVSGC